MSTTTDINVTIPATIYVRLESPVSRFDLYNSKGRLEYFRYLGQNITRFKFNVPKPGQYTSNVPVEVIKTTPIEIDKRVLDIVLPPAERDRLKNTTIEYNPNLEGTPAANYTDDGIVEVSEEFIYFPAPIKLFILIHEQGHYFYRTEKYCDLYAYVNFLRMGHNRSMAYYALDRVLSRTPENISRLDYMLSTIKDTTGEFQP